MNHLIKRRGYWHFNRRVPDHIRHLDDRELVRASTKVRVGDDPKGLTAARVAFRMNESLETHWRLLNAGKGGAARIALRAAIKRTRLLGLDYLPAAELAGRGVQEVLQRVLIARDGPQDPASIAAVLGGIQAQASGILVSGLFGEFEIARAVEIKDKSAEQMRVWRNKYIRAANNLLEVVGDKDVSHLTRGDAQEFKRWWTDRVLEEGLQRDTANKDFEYFGAMLETVSEAHKLDLVPIFAKLAFKGSDAEEGVPFEPDFVQDRILGGGLDDLNPEARRICLVMSGTGLRPSEITSLEKGTIRLGERIPFVAVRANGREVKSKNALREIALFGPALEAMKLQPEGFRRYHDKNGSLSATVNKYFTDHGLRPTTDHSLYSLRHTFKARLRAIEAPEEMVDQIMAHANSKPKYGRRRNAGGGRSAYPLEQTARWLERVAFKIVPGAKI